MASAAARRGATLVASAARRGRRATVGAGTSATAGGRMTGCRRRGRGLRRCGGGVTTGGGCFLGFVGPNLSEPPRQSGGKRGSRPKRLANYSSSIHGCLQRNLYSQFQSTERIIAGDSIRLARLSHSGGLDSPGVLSYVDPDSIQVSSTLPASNSTTSPAPSRRRLATPLAPLNV